MCCSRELGKPLGSGTPSLSIVSQRHRRPRHRPHCRSFAASSCLLFGSLVRVHHHDLTPIPNTGSCSILAVAPTLSLRLLARALGGAGVYDPAVCRQPTHAVCRQPLARHVSPPWLEARKQRKLGEKAGLQKLCAYVRPHACIRPPASTFEAWHFPALHPPSVPPGTRLIECYALPHNVFPPSYASFVTTTLHCFAARHSPDPGECSSV